MHWMCMGLRQVCGWMSVRGTDACGCKSVERAQPGLPTKVFDLWCGYSQPLQFLQSSQGLLTNSSSILSTHSGERHNMLLSVWPCKQRKARWTKNLAFFKSMVELTANRIKSLEQFVELQEEIRGGLSVVLWTSPVNLTTKILHDFGLCWVETYHKYLYIYIFSFFGSVPREILPSAVYWSGSEPEVILRLWGRTPIRC